jgi:hypothetical protein
MRSAIRLGLMGCLAGVVLGGVLEAKFGIIGRLPLFEGVSGPQVELATYRQQQITNEVRGGFDWILLPVEVRRQLKEMDAEEVALRDRALSLKTRDEVEAARNEYFLLQEKRELSFIGQHGRDINQANVLMDFIAGKFGAQFPVVMESEAYEQILSNFNGAFGPEVHVTDLTDQIIKALQEEIDGTIPGENR